MTNLHGIRTTKHWSPLTTQELRAYIGVLILAGMYRSRHEATSSLWGVKTGRPLFADAMAHRRFMEINRTLRFDDKLRRPQQHGTMPTSCRRYRSCGAAGITGCKKCTMWDCVDEQLIAFRGRCNFKQHIPAKPAKYGIKIWALCDVQTSYDSKLEVYTGKPPGGTREVNVGMRVVLGLTDSLEGHTITVDMFFLPPCRLQQN